MDPSVAVAPDIFDVVATPDVVLPVVTAHIMSPWLWQLGQRAADAREPHVAAQQVINRSFTHATPTAMAETFGVLSLADERARLGDEVVDRTVAGILDVAAALRRQGVVDPDPAIEWHLQAGTFPGYAYVNADLIHATRVHLGRAVCRSGGITSCLDEALLFASLAVVLPAFERQLDGIVLLGSPAHYTVFGWTGDDAWWFWGKNLLFTRASFRDEAEAAHGGDLRVAYEARMRAIDRITSRRGSLDLVTGVGSIPDDEVQRMLAVIDDFFGHLPAGLERAQRRQAPAPQSPFEELLGDCLGRESPEQVQAIVRAHLQGGGPLAQAARLAMLSYRSLEVDDLVPYLVAARRGPLVRAAAQALATPEDAIAAVTAIAGPAPVLGDPTRLALPDEVLRLGTGSPAERALLLHVLLEAVMPDPVRTVLVGDDAITVAGDLAVRASTLGRVPPGDVPATDAPFTAVAP